MEFSYTATKGGSGRFFAVLYADDKQVVSKDNLRESAVQPWAETEALKYKRESLTAPMHGESHTKHGAFEL